ncbi:RDD family protein [Halobacillus mangrovi]|uniref:RDD domain-containing protein n=1 Tax=Halobacillus mangrovi TaxID=402384 RepID=A0A1W5ZSS2_9BACI|nr:RDD family protein [Halobacillus mangrovi]ARI76342.1 hypothetical protein HM131_05605 [Halobacillus mangrovi]
MERPAGFWIRLMASIIDSIIVGLLLGTITLFFYGEFYMEEFNFTNLLSYCYLLFVPVLWKGYVIGKRICNIRIVKITGENVTVSTMFMRVIVGGIVYFFSLGIGFIVSGIMVMTREDKRSIHDFIAGTYVKNEN